MTVGAVCPPSYQLENNGGKYKLVVQTTITSQPWTGANDDCVADQIAGSSLFTHLVVIDCSTELAYVCECDAFANDPTHYQ